MPPFLAMERLSKQKGVGLAYMLKALCPSLAGLASVVLRFMFSM